MSFFHCLVYWINLTFYIFYSHFCYFCTKCCCSAMSLKVTPTFFYYVLDLGQRDCVDCVCLESLILPLCVSVVTSSRAHTVHRQPLLERSSSMWRSGLIPVAPVSQSVYNSETSGCHGAVVNELQMPDPWANQWEEVSHQGPQTPPHWALLEHNSSCPLHLLLVFHSSMLRLTAWQRKH